MVISPVMAWSSLRNISVIPCTFQLYEVSLNIQIYQRSNVWTLKPRPCHKRLAKQRPNHLHHKAALDEVVKADSLATSSIKLAEQKSVHLGGFEYIWGHFEQVALRLCNLLRRRKVIFHLHLRAEVVAKGGESLLQLGLVYRP